MGKHENIEDTLTSGEAEGSGASASEPHASKNPKVASAGTDAGEIAASKNEAAAVESAATTAARQADLSGSRDTLHVAPGIDQLKPSHNEDAADAQEALAGAGEEAPRVSRFTLLAAALALAAALGAMVGVLAAYGLARPAATAAAAGRTGMEEIQALKENVVQTRVELAALKLSIDSATRNVAAQFTRIGERIDRVERAQAEPVAKLNKAIDVLERLSRGEAAPVPKDVTGAILPPVGLATQGGKAGAVEGWVVRDVHRLGRGDPERPDHAAALIERSPGRSPTSAAANDRCYPFWLSPARAWRRTPDPWQISRRAPLAVGASGSHGRVIRCSTSLLSFGRRRSPRRDCSPRRSRRWHR
jgi:hypothetical protein